MGKKSAEQVISEWIIDAKTPKDAWQTMTYEQIAEATGISKGYINRVLIKVVAQTLKLEYQQAKEMRLNARAGEKGVAISTELVDRINALLTEKDRATVAAELGLSYSTVARYDKKTKKNRKSKTTRRGKK